MEYVGTSETVGSAGASVSVAAGSVCAGSAVSDPELRSGIFSVTVIGRVACSVALGAADFSFLSPMAVLTREMQNTLTTTMIRIAYRIAVIRRFFFNVLIVFLLCISCMFFVGMSILARILTIIQK